MHVVLQVGVQLHIYIWYCSLWNQRSEMKRSTVVYFFMAVTINLVDMLRNSEEHAAWSSLCPLT